ncbi:24757_t:CDS:2 [Racocetra persica]|uniref:24757_t:CDS:1 n=1 Tax=Racocetra persica TaxID=160502 RepID=A0ACA9K9D2_9GLOM|nr:24757_t:CDS:2 [Racocetra persica]
MESVATMTISALVDELQEEGFFYKYKYDNSGFITHLFFAHNDSISLNHQYPTNSLVQTESENEFDEG